MTRYLLDANIVIYASLGWPAVLDRLSAHAIGDVAISSLTYSELLVGPTSPVGGGVRHDERMALIAESLDILPYDRAAAEAYGRIARRLAFNRRLVLDRMIAAHALSLGLTLVTNNAADFADVPGLRVENWAA
ncbi:MAG: type II toxin-antitoxin system VapC family toxin [Methylocystis sp.]|nr:type II toxin-antitoxin system VapC family toxin [Methylocystis sp.]